MSKVTIQYTLTAKVSIEEIASHLRRIKAEPKAVIQGVLISFENRVTDFPYGCQICPELLKIGCATYREYNSPDGYRVLYSVNESTITVHAVLSQKQDIQQLLFRRLILASFPS